MLGALALFGTGCIAHSAIVSTEKTAYVVSGSFLGTNLYHCTAASGRPVCTQVIEN